MKRYSPDAGRRRARRRDDGAAADVMPLCATGVFAAATLALATLTAPAALDGMTTTSSERCPPLAVPRPPHDDARG